MKCATLLPAITLLLATILCACQARPASAVKAKPVTAQVHAASAALTQAKTDTQAIQAQAPEIAAQAPQVAPLVEAVVAHAANAEAQISVAQVQGAQVVAGIAERDKTIAAQTTRANKAEVALQDRARNRIEWALILGGFGCWGVAGLLIYQLATGGAGLSIIRRSTTIICLFAAGAACFAAAVYFDDILRIGAWTLGLLVSSALVGGVLHYRKHIKRERMVSASAPLMPAA